MIRSCAIRCDISEYVKCGRSNHRCPFFVCIRFHRLQPHLGFILINYGHRFSRRCCPCRWFQHRIWPCRVRMVNRRLFAVTHNHADNGHCLILISPGIRLHLVQTSIRDIRDIGSLGALDRFHTEWWTNKFISKTYVFLCWLCVNSCACSCVCSFVCSCVCVLVCLFVCSYYRCADFPTNFPILRIKHKLAYGLWKGQHTQGLLSASQLRIVEMNKYWSLLDYKFVYLMFHSDPKIDYNHWVSRFNCDPQPWCLELNFTFVCVSFIRMGQTKLRSSD